MKKGIALLLALIMMMSFAACGEKPEAPTDAPTEISTETPTTAEEPIELTVFAAASLTETLTRIAEQYKTVAPNVNLVFNFDSSGTLKTQIEEGATCDLFLSAAQKQMNALADEDLLNANSRIDLLENKVVLAVPDGNPAGVTQFEDAATDKVKLIALGNSDVPVGQYSEEIYTYLGVWEQMQSKITFGSNVKEVTTWVSEGAADCGVVYATDAYSAGLSIVATAPAEWMKNRVVYPAAVLKQSARADAAQAFLNYLSGGECDTIFESVGFAMCK